MKKKKINVKVKSFFFSRNKKIFFLKNWLTLKLTPSSSKCTLSTLRPAGRDTVKKYARDPNEFESDHNNALEKDRPRTSKLKK